MPKGHPANILIDKVASVWFINLAEFVYLFLILSGRSVSREKYLSPNQNVPMAGSGWG
jgi:hypothetical protein